MLYSQSNMQAGRLREMKEGGRSAGREEMVGLQLVISGALDLSKDNKER